MLAGTILRKLSGMSVIWVTLVVLVVSTTRAADRLHARRNNVVTRQAQLLPNRAVSLTVPGLNERTVNVHNLGSQAFYPPLVRGDRELGGPADIKIAVRFFVKNNQVHRQIYMMAEERGVSGGWLASKPSKAEGWSFPIDIYTPPPGWQLKPFNTVDHRLPEYIDFDHTPEVHNTHIGRVTVFGDRKGKDIGFGEYTRVDIDWDYILPVVIQRRADDVSRFTQK